MQKKAACRLPGLFAVAAQCYCLEACSSSPRNGERGMRASDFRPWVGLRQDRRCEERPRRLDRKAESDNPDYLHLESLRNNPRSHSLPLSPVVLGIWYLRFSFRCLSEVLWHGLLPKWTSVFVTRARSENEDFLHSERQTANVNANRFNLLAGE